MRAKITKEDREWAKKIKEKYGNRCIVCAETKYINAHHIIPRQKKEFRHDLRNGIALCPSHHRFSFTFSAHQNPYIFYSWLAKHRTLIINEVNEMLNEKWKN